MGELFHWRFLSQNVFHGIAHLDPCFTDIDFRCQFFPQCDVRIMFLFKHFLKFFQLTLSKGCSVSSLFSTNGRIIVGQTRRGLVGAVENAS